jgi:alpha-galactosidase
MPAKVKPQSQGVSRTLPFMRATFVLVAACFSAFAPLITAYNNGVGRLPPMGWNTWCTDDLCGLIDVVRVSSSRFVVVAFEFPSLQCTESEIMSIADAIVEQGLDKLGYQCVGPGIGWALV